MQCCELERRDWELERRPGSAKVLGECILRSSGRLAARAEVCEWPLERGVLRSSGRLGLNPEIVTFQITFSLSLLSLTFPKTPLLSLSL